VYLPVYNGVSIKANEVSGKPEQLFKYVDSDYLNNTILTAIKTSVEVPEIYFRSCFYGRILSL